MHRSAVLQRPLAAHNCYCTHTPTLRSISWSRTVSNEKSALQHTGDLSCASPGRLHPVRLCSIQLMASSTHKVPPTDSHYTKLLPVLQLNPLARSLTLHEATRMSKRAYSGTSTSLHEFACRQSTLKHLNIRLSKYFLHWHSPIANERHLGDCISQELHHLLMNLGHFLRSSRPKNLQTVSSELRGQTTATRFAV